MKQGNAILKPGDDCRRSGSDDHVAREVARAASSKLGDGVAVARPGFAACAGCEGACVLHGACPQALGGFDLLSWSLRQAFDAPLAGFGQRGDVRAAFIHLILGAHGCRSAEDVHRQVAAMQSELDAYKAALDQHAIVAITDRGGRITHVNNPFCRISGYRRDELIGQRHSIVNSRHHPRAFFAGMWRAIARGDVWRGEICNKARDGRLYWVDTTIVPFHDAADRIGGYVSIRYDITERKNAEAALREENARREQAETLLMDVIDAVPDGIIAFDRDDRLVLVNQAYKRFHAEIADHIEAGMPFEAMMELAVRRGQFDIFEKGMRAAVERRQRLAGALRADLAARRLAIALQPQIRIDDGAHAGFEALARWSHDGAPVPPPEFIRLAEETGLIVRLGERVLEMALASFRAMLDEGLRPGGVSVNVAAAQLKLGGFPGTVEALLKHYRVPAAMLEIEITENVLLDRDPGRIHRSLDALKGLGVRVALDDFGTGFASLTHLKRFPVDRLKIDRSFVRNIETDSGDAAISRAIIGLAHSLGPEVVAEGVETEGQLAFLRDNGCGYAQGYLFGRPEPAEGAQACLRRIRAAGPAALQAAE